MIPDFAFTHRQDGRRALLEIVGFRHHNYTGNGHKVTFLPEVCVSEIYRCQYTCGANWKECGRPDERT